MIENYGINDIETLSFRDGVRQRIAMYLGSADMQGVYNAIQEIISNSIDEFYMGYGSKIEIFLYRDGRISIRDYGRGVPFGIKEDGSNVLVDIFSKPHTGGKFNDKVYQSVAGLNGIGAKATCLSSEEFQVFSVRNGRHAIAIFKKGQLIDYTEQANIHNLKDGTGIEFLLDKEVYNLEPIDIQFDVLCEKCKNLSYLTKGLTFELTGPNGEFSRYCAKNGLLDLIKDNANNPVHSTPLYFELKEDNLEAEVALMWTKEKEKSFTFTNGLHNSEGGTSLTGVKTAITNFMKKQFKGGFEGDMARTGLIYAVSCKIPNPSFANQTKTKINNPQLRGLAQRTCTQALSNFKDYHKDEFKSIIDFLAKEKKAEAAADRARESVLKATKSIAENQKKKVFASDKLKNAEFLGQDSTLLLVEGNSAAASMAVARDPKKYGILALRGKMINCLSNPEEKIFDNEEIKLLLSAMNIMPGKYNADRLRYGRIAICSDADSDGYHIGLLIMSALKYLCPEFLEEGRLCWLRSPLYIVSKAGKETYYFTDEEFNAAKTSISGEVSRNKGLGSLSAEQAHNSMFTEEFQRMETLEVDDSAFALLEALMGENVLPRKDFVFEKVDFSEIRE